MVRRPEIILSPTIFSTFGVLGVLGRQKGAKSALRRHQMIDFRPFRACSDTIARVAAFLPSWTLFAMRSLHLYRSTRETKNVITNRIVDTFGHLEDSLEIIVDSGKYWIAMAGIGGLRQVYVALGQRTESGQLI